jgi:hypothetical protein
MKQLPGVDNLRNYPAENIKELEELLLSGVSAVPDPKRKHFYDIETHERTFFIQISSITGRVALLATWLRPNAQLRLRVEPGRRMDIRCHANSGGETLMKIIRAVVLCAAGLTAASAFAQSQPADSNMQILRDKVKADKKLVVAANMDLNDAEGKVFWPIYEAYQKDLQGLNDRLFKEILAYADAYNKNALTDEQAINLTNAALTVDQDEVTMRKTYADKLKGVLPGKKVARYLQIENKIRALVRYEMANNIPLVP